MATPWNPEIVVGVPAYNEEDTITHVVTRALPHATAVVVVDDGSTDRTARRALLAGATVIRHSYNGGKGAAVASLFDYAAERRADALVLLDGDGQHDPAEIPEVVAPVLAGAADVVVGSRFLTTHSAIPFHRTVGQRTFNLLTFLASGMRCSDSQSGFRAFGRDAFCAMRITERSFSVECEQQFEYRAHGLRVAEVPISCRYDVPEKRSAYVQGLEVLTRLCAMSLERRILGQTPVAVARPRRMLAPLSREAELVIALAAD
jgi:glycosyltransferase involved in cell wall biosynthesis